nr:translation initiation factor IF-2-like [Pan troglodytes]
MGQCNGTRWMSCIEWICATVEKHSTWESTAFTVSMRRKTPKEPGAVAEARLRRRSLGGPRDHPPRQKLGSLTLRILGQLDCSTARFRTRSGAASGPTPRRAQELALPAGPARCASRRVPGPVTARLACATYGPTRGPTPWLPAPSPTPASSSPSFQLPSPALSRARSPLPALASSRAAPTANEVQGRVRRFKRRLLREAGREIRRCGQNPAGDCEPCRTASCGGEGRGRAPVAEPGWGQGGEADKRREKPAEGGIAPPDMLGVSLAGPGRG